METTRGRTSSALVRFAALFVCLSCGCGGASQAVPTAVASDTPQARNAAELRGVWMQYWARTGQADTQRYDFSDDGTFSWSAAARPAPARNAARKSGHFELQRQGSVNALVLRVEREEFAACAACEGAASAARVLEHAEPLLEQLELGECAQNQEARDLDASYACIAISGRAFWRRPQ
jgi:hypothetical protein